MEREFAIATRQLHEFATNLGITDTSIHDAINIAAYIAHMILEPKRINKKSLIKVLILIVICVVIYFALL